MLTVEFKPSEERGSPDSAATDSSANLIDLGSILDIKTELSQPFTHIKILARNDEGRVIYDSAITEMKIPERGNADAGQKTVVIGESQFAYRDYHLYIHDEFRTKKDAPEPGYRSQTDLQATILIKNGIKPDIVIRHTVVNKKTQSIIEEAVAAFGEGSKHATLTPGSGKAGMTDLYKRALVSDNLRPTVQGMERYPTFFEGRVPTQVDVIWNAGQPDSSIISVSFEKKK